MREREVEAALVKAVRDAGGTAYKFSSPGHAGVPDRVCVFPPYGRIVFVEVKAPGKKPTALQWKEIRRLRNMGCRVEVIDSKEQIPEILKL